MASSIATEKVAQCEVTMMLPPGLAPPPGLELPARPQTIAPPPGLGETAGDRLASASPMYVASSLNVPAHGATVQISSLPNHILSDAMMSATLDQAQLDKFVIKFVTKPGAQRGEAIITLSSQDAAVRCARHFHGRRWDSSGIPVSARVMGGNVKAAPKQPMKAPTLKKSFAFSTAAAEFVPGGFLTTSSTRQSTKETVTPSMGSDVSTDDGESASSSGTPRESEIAG